MNITKYRYQDTVQSLHQRLPRYIMKTSHKYRYQVVTQLRYDNPDMTLLAIGNIVGLTKERVRQILKRASMATGATRPPHICFTCNTIMPKGTYNKYHVECRPTNTSIDEVCTYCDKIFQLRKSQHKAQLNRAQLKHNQKIIYCSHSCSTNAYWDSVRRGDLPKRPNRSPKKMPAIKMPLRLDNESGRNHDRFIFQCIKS